MRQGNLFDDETDAGLVGGGLQLRAGFDCLGCLVLLPTLLDMGAPRPGAVLLSAFSNGRAMPRALPAFARAFADAFALPLPASVSGVVPRSRASDREVSLPFPSAGRSSSPMTSMRFASAAFAACAKSSPSTSLSSSAFAIAFSMSAFMASVVCQILILRSSGQPSTPSGKARI
eukprot:scaffold825_cov249-Pinguiococcus_pyrenoidosus.AAC.57